jgi:uncharacterized repeat protein (TIGR01451 family)
VSQADIDAGSITNTAFATDGTTVSPNDSATVTAVQSPALGIVKTATPTSFGSVGEIIAYSFVVTNTGNVTLFNLSVVDDVATDEGSPARRAPR